MKLVRNVVFAAAVGAVLFSMIAVCALDAAVPGFEAPRESYLEGSEYTDPRKVLEGSFLDGSFQSESEDLAADRVPCRNEVLLLNAKLQRAGIAASAALFGFDAYPTFYSSSHMVVPSQGRLVSIASRSPKSAKAHKALCERISGAARRHPDVRFVVDWVQKNSQTRKNPTAGLRGASGLLDEKWIDKHLVGNLDESISVHVDNIYDDEHRLVSDHHWSLPRALESYNRIAGELGLEAVDWDGLETGVAVDGWFGSEARAGLDDEHLNVTLDELRDFGELAFWKLKGDEPLEQAKAGLREAVLSGRATDEDREVLRFSGYSKYFGGGNARISNSGPNNGKNLLVVGDSYTFCLKRYFAANYANTYCVLPGNHKVDAGLDELIDEYDIDDVVVMMHANKAASIAKKSPAFLGGDFAGDAEEDAGDD